MARRVGLSLLLLIPSAFLTSPGAAQRERVTVRVPRVSRPPKLDDFLTNTPRGAEALVTDFRQREPGDGVPVSQPTAAYLSYDDKNLYVVFVCEDDPGKVRARMSKREDIDSDDSVVINLDTFNDHQRAYTFSSNPLGIQQDFIFTEGQGPDLSFDTLWYSQGRLTPDGYIVWMAIPFKSLRFPSGPVQNWGIGLGRSIVRNNEFSTWPHITQRIESYLQQLGTLEGLERISPGHNLQFIPYGQFARARVLNTQIPQFRTDNDARAGLDAKMVLRDAFALDLTLNPDFSQVESDEPQVIINQRFRVFFPEKRPFFIENANFFQTPINLFFSRTIADPQFGARLTGKLRHWALGSLLIDDRAEGKTLPPSDPYHGDRAGIVAVRVQREFSSQSTLGLLVSSRDFGASSNRLFALDTRIKLGSNWVLSGQVVRSYTHNLNGSRRAGPAYWSELGFTGRHLVYAARYNDISPSFHTDLGFIPRIDIRRMEHYFRYYWKPERSRVVVIGPDLTTQVNWDRQGRVQDWLVDASFGADLKGPTGMGCRRVEAFELFQGFRFRRHSTDCGVNTEWLNWLALTADYGWGVNINYFPAAGLVPFLARQNSVTFGLTLRPTPRFRFRQTYMYTRLGTLPGSAWFGSGSGKSIFNNHILRSKVNYQFTKELSLRAIFDYNAVLANPQLIDLNTTFSSTLSGAPPTKHFRADILVTYLLNPGTAFYIGYTDNYEDLDVVPGAPTLPPKLVYVGSPTVSTGRQFFVKISYLLRY